MIILLLSHAKANYCKFPTKPSFANDNHMMVLKYHTPAFALPYIKQNFLSDNTALSASIYARFVVADLKFMLFT